MASSPKNRPPLEIPRFFGLDLKTNIIDVKDGFSLDLKNCQQNSIGIMSKRPGNEPLFASDEDEELAIDEVGSATLSGTKYWFKFVNGVFRYATSRTGAVTTITPSPAVSTVNPIWWAVIDDKLFFVDGTNALRYFNGTAILASSIYARPTVALTTAAVGTGFDYTYTVDNGLGESPACGTLLTNKASAATVRITGNTGPQTLVAGNVVRVYSKATTIAAASKLVATFTWDAASVTAGFKDLATVAIADDQVQLYSELGVALNKTAPSALVGIAIHQNRLVGWKGSRVHNAKSSNAHSWPDDSAQKEAFVYGFSIGDGEDITACVSYQKNLVVLKPTKVAVFGGIGPDDTGGNAYSFDRVETNEIGCIAGKSARVVGENEKSYLIYLSRQGFMMLTPGGHSRVGENIETQLIGVSDALLSAAVAFHHKRAGLYICFLGAAAAKTGWVLDVRKDNDVMVGWFRWADLHARCVHYDDDRFIFGTSTGLCASERVSRTASDFSDIRAERVEDTAFYNPSGIGVSLEYQTGDSVVVRTMDGVMPSVPDLVPNQTYFVIRVSATRIELAETLQDALDGVAMEFAVEGAGTYTLISKSPISAYYTTNWLNFGSKLKLKKLQKLGVLLNAVASQVSILVEAAYDWSAVFFSAETISITSSHEWGDTSVGWGGFPWSGGAAASPRNVSGFRRKINAIRYRFSNEELDQDFNLQGIEQEFDILRNRGRAA